jgi:hypothetical protein
VSAPGVGGPSDEYRAICQFTGLTDHGPACGQPAQVHILTVATGWGLVALASCGRHAGVARRAGAYQAEHLHAGVCGLPGVVWTNEACVIDASGVEPELRPARELELVR